MTAASDRTEDARSRNHGILVICAGVLCVVVNDAMAKWLTQHYAPLQIAFLRNALALPAIVAITVSLGGWPALRSRHVRVHAVRGLFLIGATYCFFLGLQSLPLAEATSLVFSAPIFITALSIPLLGEHVGWRRWSAVIAGFIGVLIIVRPGLAAFQPAALFSVATAVFYALTMISARWIRRDEGFWTMMVYVTLFPALFSGLFVSLQWQTPQLTHLPVFLGLAVFGTLGVTLMGHAFRLAPAAVVAPFDYTALIWASLFGWLVWGDIPGPWVYVGAGVIIASGLYIALRERGDSPP